MEIRLLKKTPDKHGIGYSSVTKRPTKTGGELVKCLGIIPLGKVCFSFQTNTGKYQSFIIYGQRKAQ